jgi:hypothetical protein
MTSIEEIENLEIFYLIWLGNLVNNEYQQQLRTIINYLLIFENEQKCLDYIHSRTKDDRIIFIVKGKLGQQILPHIAHLQQIHSIYVYSNDKKTNEQWTKNYKKVTFEFSSIAFFSCSIRSKESLFEKKNFFNVFEPIKLNDNVINSIKYYPTIFSISEKLVVFIHNY